MLNNLDPENRLNYKGDLQKVAERACAFFSIGTLVKADHLAEGYEDCNLRLQTDCGIYVCKLFADNQLGDYKKTRRGEDVADRLVEIILTVRANGARTPNMLKGETSYLYREGELVALCYEWIDGSSYYDLGRSPNDKELEHTIKQVALINTTDLRPVYYHDIWAVPHIHALFNKVQPCLSNEDSLLIEQVLKRFSAIKLDDLPKCLVHGDLTKGNVLLGEDGEPHIIDFSVVNWTTRIIELSLIVSNLLYDENDSRSLKEKSELIVSMYQTYNPLTDEETQALPNLSLAASAMEFLGSVWRQKFLGDDSQETIYWLKLGRKTLTRELGSID